MARGQANQDVVDQAVIAAQSKQRKKAPYANQAVLDMLAAQPPPTAAAPPVSPGDVGAHSGYIDLALGDDRL